MRLRVRFNGPLPTRALVLLLAVALLSCSRGGDSRPNVVFLIGDDHGYPYYGFTGSSIVQTPTLDRLASEGALFHQGFSTSSVCRPSLFSLLTSRFPYDRRLYEEEVPESRQLVVGTPVAEFGTLPGLLSRAGYATFQGGKHWEGPYAASGFTEGMSGAGPYDRERAMELSPLATLAGGGGLALGRDTMEPVYDFVDRHLDTPFFLWFAPMLPHAPMDPPEEYRRRYAGQELSSSAQVYYANITRFDSVVAELLDHLERRGVLEQTLVIYLSDNGLDQPPGRQYPSFGGPSGKLSVRELGFRTPILVHWPERIRGGFTSEDLVSALDIGPTILDYAGIPIPDDWPGRSLRGAIERGEPVGRDVLIGWQERERLAQPRRQILTRPFFWAVSDLRHYVFTPETGEEQLFNRSASPYGAPDVSGEHLQATAAMRARVEAWRDERTASVKELIATSKRTPTD